MACVPVCCQITVPTTADNLFNLINAAGELPSAVSTKYAVSVLSMQGDATNTVPVFWGCKSTVAATGDQRGGFVPVGGGVIFDGPMVNIDLASIWVVASIGSQILFVTGFTA